LKNVTQPVASLDLGAEGETRDKAFVKGTPVTQRVPHLHGWGVDQDLLAD
jgi:hypothetical protein